MQKRIRQRMQASWHHHPVIDSTNSCLMRVHESEIMDGLTCSADTQTQGFGRRGRTWFSPYGGLYMSILLIPEAEPARWQLTAFVMGVAAATSIHALHPDVHATLKWPNDILIDGCKAGGILVQSATGPVPRVVAGIGLNVTTESESLPANTLFPACSISRFSKTVPSIKQMERTIRRSFFALYEQWLSHPDFIMEKWESLSALHNTVITVGNDHQRVTGLYSGVAGDGSLIIKPHSGDRVFFSGDIVSIKGIPS